jgi:hypothetical protein
MAGKVLERPAAGATIYQGTELFVRVVCQTLVRMCDQKGALTVQHVHHQQARLPTRFGHALALQDLSGL